MDIKRDDKRVEARLDGDLVSTVTDEVREELKKMVVEGVTEVRLDMAKTEVIDSIGLGLVISLHNSLAKAGGSLSVVNLSPDIQGLFRNMRLDRHVTVIGA